MEQIVLLSFSFWALTPYLCPSADQLFLVVLPRVLVIRCVNCHDVVLRPSAKECLVPPPRLAHFYPPLRRLLPQFSDEARARTKMPTPIVRTTMQFFVMLLIWARLPDTWIRRNVELLCWLDRVCEVIWAHFG